jgi:hypothetical protein
MMGVEEMNNADPKEREISIVELVQVIWRGKWLIAGTTVAALLAMFLFNLFVPPVPRYEEWARVQLTGGNNFGRGAIVGRILHSDEFIQTVSAKINGYSDDELRETALNLLTEMEVTFETVVDGRPVVSSEVVELTLEGTDPDLIHTWFTAALAELESRSHEHYNKRRELQEAHLASLQDQIIQVESSIQKAEKLVEAEALTLENLDTLAALLQSRETLIQEEYKLSTNLLEEQPFKVLSAPRHQTEAKPALLARPNLVVSGLLGMILGVIVVFLQDYIRVVIAAKNSK